MISRKEAVARLTARWKEQCEKFPLMRREIPLKLYIRVNLSKVQRGDMLKDYATASERREARGVSK